MNHTPLPTHTYIHTQNNGSNKVNNESTRIVFLQKQMSPPFGVRKKMQLRTKILVCVLVNYRFNIQQRCLANAVNYCTTNPSFGKKLFFLSYTVELQRLELGWFIHLGWLKLSPWSLQVILIGHSSPWMGVTTLG